MQVLESHDVRLGSFAEVGQPVGDVPLLAPKADMLVVGINVS
jgi:hypothetical protein